MPDQTDAQRLADTADIILGAVENGPWLLIADPPLRKLVGEYVAENCHSIAAAAGLDKAMERAHDAMPQRLPTGGRLLPADARKRLARHWWVTGGGFPELWDRIDAGGTAEGSSEEQWWSVAVAGYHDLLAKADELLAVITGES